MRKFLSPKRIRQTLRGIKEVRAGGGPRRVKLVDVTEPKGVFVGASMLTFEVEAQDGSVRDVSTFIPIPFLYSWGYRLGRKFKLPVFRSLDPKRVKFDVTLPKRRQKASQEDKVAA